MVQAMAEWYMQGDTPDPSKMSRILDVTQDTKVHRIYVIIFELAHLILEI